MSNDLPVREILYVGRRVLTNEKIGRAFIPADRLPDDPRDVKALAGHVSFFSGIKRGSAPLIVGARYNAPCNLDPDGRISTLSFGKLQFIAMHENAHWRTMLCTHDEAAYLEHKSAARLKKLAASSQLDDDLERLRQAYKTLPFNERTAFEIAVLHYLRRGK